MEVIGAERGAVRELETVHALDRTKRLGLERFEQGFDLVAELVADLVGSRHCAEGGENGGEEEINAREDPIADTHSWGRQFGDSFGWATCSALSPFEAPTARHEMAPFQRR